MALEESKSIQDDDCGSEYAASIPSTRGTGFSKHSGDREGWFNLHSFYPCCQRSVGLSCGFKLLTTSFSTVRAQVEDITPSLQEIAANIEASFSWSIPSLDVQQIPLAQLSSLRQKLVGFRIKDTIVESLRLVGFAGAGLGTEPGFGISAVLITEFDSNFGTWRSEMTKSLVATEGLLENFSIVESDSDCFIEGIVDGIKLQIFVNNFERLRTCSIFEQYVAIDDRAASLMMAFCAVFAKIDQSSIPVEKQLTEYKITWLVIEFLQSVVYPAVLPPVMMILTGAQRLLTATHRAENRLPLFDVAATTLSGQPLSSWRWKGENKMSVGTLLCLLLNHHKKIRTDRYVTCKFTEEKLFYEFDFSQAYELLSSAVVEEEPVAAKSKNAKRSQENSEEIVQINAKKKKKLQKKSN